MSCICLPSGHLVHLPSALLPLSTAASADRPGLHTNIPGLLRRWPSTIPQSGPDTTPRTTRGNGVLEYRDVYDREYVELDMDHCGYHVRVGGGWE